MSRWQAASDDPGGEADDPLAEQIAAALEAKGYRRRSRRGPVAFPLRPGGPPRRRNGLPAGNPVDNDSYYDQSDLLERDLMRPKLLRDFGWKVTFVLAKDWYEDRAAVLQRLERLLAGDEQAADKDDDDDA